MERNSSSACFGVSRRWLCLQRWPMRTLFRLSVHSYSQVEQRTFQDATTDSGYGSSGSYPRSSQVGFRFLG